jgi:hypothetical protein
VVRRGQLFWEFVVSWRLDFVEIAGAKEKSKDEALISSVP